MTNVSPEVCFSIREARRQAKLSQSDLAAEVGCKQSALSMFEQGDATKLSEDVVIRLSQKFNVPITAPDGKGGEMPRALPRPVTPTFGFCPNPSCPSNHAYTVGSKTFLKPERSVADPVGGRYCAVCGEVLEKRCPNCGAAVHDGAVCSLCGEPYIAT